MKYSKRTIKNTISGVKYHFLLLISGVLLAISCSEMQTETPLAEQRQELTPEQTELRSKLKDTALLLKQVVAQPDARRELRYAIRYYRDEQNTDERVSFSSLLDEEAEYKTTWRKQKVADAGSSTFADAFRKAVLRKRKETSSSSFDLEEFLNQEGVEIYFPYSENWEDKDVIPTLTYDPIDNEDINEGWKPALPAKAKTADMPTLASVETWNGVTVDDEYAFTNPTFIVLPPEDDGGGGTSGGSDGDGKVCEAPTCANRVFIGWSRLTRQFDGIFAGRSEIRWVSADLVRLTADNLPELKPSRVAYDFSRADIRNKRWKKLYSQFDSDWEREELSKELYIYEADGNGLISIKLGIQVDLGKVKPNFSLDYQVSKKRETLLRTYYKRSVFMAENEEDFGNGLRDGFAVRYANHLKWTMPVREIQLN